MGEPLTALDATFLELEEADQAAHMHIGGVMVFEARRDGQAPRLSEVCAQLDERLGTLPRYHQRLSQATTGGLSWPSWEPDPRFDIATHVRREALPAPGGEGELLAWAGEFFSERLDRARPLWEAVVLEGLEGGRWALATKTHHCMVDGVGSVDVAQLMLDAEPAPARPGNAAREPSSAEGVAPHSKRPGPSIAWNAAEKIVRLPVGVAHAAMRAAGLGLRPVLHPRAAMERGRAMTEVLIRDELVAAPRSSVNVPIGGKRRLAVSSAQLAEIKQVKTHLGGTVNDVVLAIAAGGLRRLLLSRGEEPPPNGLRAMVPMNVRQASEQLALGNRISSLFVQIPVDEPDPLERYLLQMAYAEDLKSGRQALGSSALIDLTAHAPPVLHTFLARSLFATRLFNLTITNVPGPQMPLYAFGSRLRDVWPLVPLASEHSVALAVFSYDGTVFFCLNADMDSMVDLDVLSRGMEESFAELRSAVADGARTQVGAAAARQKGTDTTSEE